MCRLMVYLGMEVPAFVLHSPHGQQQSATYPRDPGQLSQSHCAALHRREVMNHRDGKHRVERLITVRKAQVVADYHLEM